MNPPPQTPEGGYAVSHGQGILSFGSFGFFFRWLFALWLFSTSCVAYFALSRSFRSLQILHGSADGLLFDPRVDFLTMGLAAPHEDLLFDEADGEGGEGEADGDADGVLHLTAKERHALDVQRQKSSLMLSESLPLTAQLSLITAEARALHRKIDEVAARLQRQHSGVSARMAEARLKSAREEIAGMFAGSSCAGLQSDGGTGLGKADGGPGSRRAGRDAALRGSQDESAAVTVEGASTAFLQESHHIPQNFTCNMAYLEGLESYTPPQETVSSEHTFILLNNTQILGHDLEPPIRIHNSTISGCATACANTQTCEAWTLNLMEDSPYYRRCYLKDRNFHQNVHGKQNCISGGRKNATVAAQRYLRASSISEQRNSKLVSFEGLVNIARVTNRTLVVPDDIANDYNLEAVSEMGVEMVDEAYYAQALRWQLPYANIGFHNCDKSIGQGAVACLPCESGNLTVSSADEYLSLAGGNIGSILLCGPSLVNIVYYKRCGKRDDAVLMPHPHFFLDYHPRFHEDAVQFLRRKNLSPRNVIATHLRTEKWGSADEAFGAECMPDFENAVVDRVREYASSSTDFMALYIASDAMPGGVTTSSTYDNGGSLGKKRRKEYEDMMRRIMHRIRLETELVILMCPPETSYTERGILDQIIGASAGAFVGTCRFTRSSSIPVGTEVCRKKRSVCGNYGEWIFRYRDKYNYNTTIV